MADVADTFDHAAVANGIGRLLQHITSTINQPHTQDVLSQEQPNTPVTDTPQAKDETLTAAQAPAPDPGAASDTVDPVPAGTPVSSGYGPRGNGFHHGIDLAVPNGTTLKAAISGTVTHAADDDPSGYGSWIEITGANGMSVRYGHLSHIGAHVGDKVSAGQPIGNSGGVAGAAGSGDSSAPHLHFEVRNNGAPIDPTSFLSSAGQSGAATSAPTSGPTTTTTETPIPINPQDAADTAVARATDFLSGQGDPGSQNQQQVKEETTTTSGEQGKTPEQSTGNWAGDVLAGIGAPVTPENLRVMDAWARAEGGASHNNWLNTTQGAPGATNFNSVGVKSYTSYQQGVAATIQTLLNGYYPAILAALRAGNSAASVANAIAASPWGTGQLVQQIIGGR